MKNKKTKGEQMLFDRMERKVTENYRQKGKTDFAPNGKWFRLAKRSYFVNAYFAVFTLFLNLFVLADMTFWSKYFQKMPTELAYYKSNVVFVHFLMVFAASALILMHYKQRAIACKIQYLFGVGCVLQVAFMVYGYPPQNLSLLIGIYCVSFLSFIGSFTMDIILMLHKRRVKQAVENEYLKIYDTIDIDEGQLHDEESWQNTLLEHELQMTEKKTESTKKKKVKSKK